MDYLLAWSLGLSIAALASCFSIPNVLIFATVIGLSVAEQGKDSAPDLEAVIQVVTRTNANEDFAPQEYIKNTDYRELPEPPG